MRLYHKPITQSPYSLDELGIGRVIFNFLPQPVDVNHDGIFIHNGFSPDHAVDHFLGENPVDVIHKQLDNGIFLGRKNHFCFVFIETQGGGVIPERACNSNGLSTVESSFASADQSLDLCAQNDGIKGLGYIVIGADVQSVQCVVILFSAADNDDRCLDAPAAELLPCMFTSRRIRS